MKKSLNSKKIILINFLLRILNKFIYDAKMEFEIYIDNYNLKQ